MDGLNQKLRNFLGKYKYVAIVIAIGVGLMLLPEGEEETEIVTDVPEASMDLQQELEQILAQISGVGKVSVLLTQAEGESILYQTDTDTSGTDTVIITDSDKNQQGLVIQTYAPRYLGAVIVCQGGDSSTVKLAVVEAVSRATGLGADQICVLKMK